jgi:ribosome-binding protein aMBF1 (putative translation factor)
VAAIIESLQCDRTALSSGASLAQSFNENGVKSCGGHGHHRARLSEAMMKTEDVRPAKARVVVSVGESVRIVRELEGLTQSELAQRTKIPQISDLGD